MLRTAKSPRSRGHALLGGAGVPGPYVLVGPSFGGLVIAAYAMRYPADAAGLVFVDADEPCPQACTNDPPEPATFDVGGANFGDRPVVVLVAEFGLVGDGRAWARRSTGSILVTALGSGHAIISDKPALVAEATRLVAGSVRNQMALPACTASPLPAAGGRCETIG
jgi:pimeloyl-ACP methyl ester carboxylesterase